MARLARLTVARLPHHIIQRGNARMDIFRDTLDYQAMLGLLREMSRRFLVDVHAYALMPNHFHVLATPQGEQGLPLFMQSVGRSYVRYFNNRHGRSGTLWEGRYRATVVQERQWLLPSMVFIDANPVTAGLVQAAADWPWTSYAHNAGLGHQPLIQTHAQFWALGNTPFARDAAYTALVAQGLDQDTQEQIRHAALRGWAMGDAEFLDDLQQKTQRRVVRQRAGRPARKRELPQA